MINKNITREVTSKRKGHIIYNHQEYYDMIHLPELLKKEIVVDLSPSEWLQASNTILVEERNGQIQAAEQKNKIESARKFIATKILSELEKKYPQLKEYDASSYLKFFLNGNLSEFQRKKDSIYSIKDLEDILEVEEIKLDRVHFIMNYTRSDTLCDALSILLSDNTPFSVSIYCCPNGFYTCYIPDSDEKVFLGDAYNYTLYDSLAAGIDYNQKKSKTKKKNNNKIDEHSPTL